jgi:3',5'-cyclic-AMP phosphodiesterase
MILAPAITSKSAAVTANAGRHCHHAGLVKRFGSVTVLNGHIHQTMQKVEGNVTFHTACSTAFPQPKPGAAPSPGPMKVPAEQLRTLLGVTDIHYKKGEHALAVTDSSLA